MNYDVSLDLRENLLLVLTARVEKSANREGKYAAFKDKPIAKIQGSSYFKNHISSWYLTKQNL